MRWQGWLVLVVYTVLLCAGIYYLDAQRQKIELVAYIVVLTAALVAIIALKGERPLSWRWGNEDEGHNR